MTALDTSHAFVTERVYCVLTEELLVDKEGIHPDLSYNSVPEWDSVAHINIILSLEEAFEVSFDETGIGDLTSVEKIITAVQQLVRAKHGVLR